MSRHVIVFGAGIAGLTAAHELSRRGWRVSVYESSGAVGGFFRSARRAEYGGMPSEYSWHGMGPWYLNCFEVLRQIPAGDGSSLFDRALSRSIDFGLFPDDDEAHFFRRDAASVRRMFRLGWWDFAAGTWVMLRTWCAHRRSQTAYARRSAAAAWAGAMRGRAARTWRACFGPWVGSDWTNVSLHTAGEFFRKQLLTRPRHAHRADADGPAWTHGAGDGWLVLRGPSSEAWFDPWVADLGRRGVEIHLDAPLHRLDYADGRIRSARLESGEEVVGDHYVIAANPFATADILARTPELERLPELCLFRPLVQAGPHVQVSFRLAFAEPIRFPRPRMAVIVVDSEFNLTLFAVEQAWDRAVHLGDGIRSLWTGTACAATVPGRLYGLPLRQCTREQFVAEILAQLGSCGALDHAIRAANNGRGFRDFAPRVVEVWPEWEFSPAGISGPQPKWVNNTRTQAFQPAQRTPVANLSLAGAHTRTQADVWSIEGAVESGRRAAQVAEPAVTVQAQDRPAILRWLGRVDDALYGVRGPHVLDVLLVIVVTGLATGAWMLLR